MASHYFDLTLKAGEEKTIIFVLGYVENPDEEKWEAHNVINKKKARAMQQRFMTTGQVDKAMEELKEYWDRLLRYMYWKAMTKSSTGWSISGTRISA